MDSSTQTGATADELVRALRERFHPLTLHLGPLNAGERMTPEGGEHVYLGMANIWLCAEKGTGGTLSDDEVAACLPVFALTRSLLNSATSLMGSLATYVNQIEEEDGSDRDARLLYYLQNPNAFIVDGIARGRLPAATQSQQPL